MKIKWLGHSSFIITSDSGTKIITDPFTTGGSLSYGEIKESADIITISHTHGDHNNVATVRGNPVVVRESAVIEGIKFKSMTTYHDDAYGNKRGKNVIICFTVDEIRVCHFGDLGHKLNNKQITELGKIDILLIPVGGFYTIDANVASQICYQLKPRIIIPMHYKNDKCDFPIASLDEFLKGKKGVSRQEASDMEFKPSELPATTRIIALRPAL
ncbi:MBL fold metallo-hydrolase [Chloroflexota bacterium]